MSEVLSALAPVFILIVLGYAVRATRLASNEAFGAVNRFGYFILYPAFLFTLVSGANFGAADTIPFVGGCLLGFMAMFAIALCFKPFFGADGPAFTSMFQGSVRWNGFSLLAAALTLYGPLGVDLIGIAFGPLVLFANVVCVAALARWGSTKAASWRAVLDQIIANPLIIACAAGLAFNALSLKNLGPATDALKLIGQAAMPISLLCVGAGLDFKALRASGLRVGLTCALKLVVSPLVLFWMATWLGAGPAAAAVAAGIGSTPTAAAGYTLAREMGGDARLMAAIITATTLGSFVTMPIVIALATGAP